MRPFAKYVTPPTNLQKTPTRSCVSDDFANDRWMSWRPPHGKSSCPRCCSFLCSRRPPRRRRRPASCQEARAGSPSNKISKISTCGCSPSWPQQYLVNSLFRMRGGGQLRVRLGILNKTLNLRFVRKRATLRSPRCDQVKDYHRTLP